jgi:SagB-type dehydrogenase family enzyme
MWKINRRSCLVVVTLLAVLSTALALGPATTGPAEGKALPPPKLKGGMSLEEVLAQRRSTRQYVDQPLKIDEISQLCWAANGITEPESGKRTVPSAGAIYPMELYVVTAEGVDHYLPQGHKLERLIDGDKRPALKAAAKGQQTIGTAGACFVISAVIEKTAKKYGKDAERFCSIEAGHIGQNLLLEATALHLGCVPAGAVDGVEAAKALKLPSDQRVLYLVIVGHTR